MNRPFKILFIFPVSQVWGGEIVWLKFLEKIDMARFEPVCLIFGEGELIERLKPLKIKCYQLKKRRLRNIPYAIKNLFSMFSILKKERFAAVNSLGVHFLSFFSASILRLPYCFHIHTIHPLSFIDRWCLMRTTRIATPSYFSKDFLTKYGIKDGLIDVIPNGLDIDETKEAKAITSIRDEFNLGNATIVCYTGRIVPWKNLDKLILARPEIKLNFDEPVKFLFVGSAPELKSGKRDYKESLINLARQLGCEEDILFTGRREDVAAILKEVDIFVIPSLLEVCSISILEAMCLAKPVVAMKSGGNPEIITQSSGILVDTENQTVGIAEAILDLLKNKEKRKMLGECAVQRVLEFFSLDENSKKFDFLLEKLSLANN